MQICNSKEFLFAAVVTEDTAVPIWHWHGTKAKGIPSTDIHCDSDLPRVHKYSAGRHKTVLTVMQ